MIKAVFFDVDGTLLSFKTHKISNETLNSLFKLKEKGIKLFISTGRPKIDILKVDEIKKFPFDGFISTNGQYCYDENENEIYKKFIDKESVKQVLSFTKEKNLACHVITEDEVCVTRYNDTVFKLFELVGYKENLVSKPEEYFFDKNIFQLCPYVTYEEEVELMKNIQGCENYRWCDLFFDIIPKNGGKSLGIQKICDYYNIKREETMAFGDGNNDICMLEYVEIGVAMGNANEEVKSHADFVTTSVDENGITNALKYFDII